MADVLTETPTAATVTAALVSLGGDEMRVASALLTGGYRGVRGGSARCPVAVFLADRFPHWSVSVSNLWATVGTATDVDLPDPVAEFVISFDAGVYPDLACGDAADDDPDWVPA